MLKEKKKGSNLEQKEKRWERNLLAKFVHYMIMIVKIKQEHFPLIHCHLERSKSARSKWPVRRNKAGKSKSDLFGCSYSA